jgi:hypothetical protein
MMKKFLVFMLVLGMTSLASAVMTLDISVNGAPTPGPEADGITLDYSDTVTLDITASGYLIGDDVYILLVTPMGLASISGGVALIPPAPASTEIFGGVQEMLGDVIPGEDGRFGNIGDVAGVATGPGKYIDEILFHCLGVDDATVSLWTTVDFGTFTLADSVIINQIPEPATIALLGLGGLLLRRRK